MFPIYSISYILCPWISFSQVHVTFFIAVPTYFILIDDIFLSFLQAMRKPFLKFICNSASYFFFLFLLILVSQRIEDIMG